jgi:hypothetical protein
MSLIPKTIYQSWKTTDVPKAMARNIEKIKSMNPEYNYQFYTDDDCRKFLMDNFGVNYVNAFDVLVSGAFKCDFWRYAVLYVNGGVYMDMDLSPVKPFREILKDSDRFVSVVDRCWGATDDIPGIYQAFIACEPKSKILYDSLNLAYYNIVSRKISTNKLDITGPSVMAIAFNLYLNKQNTYTSLEIKDYGNGVRLFKIDFKKRVIIDLDGSVVIKDKYDGYEEGPNSYKTTLKIYKNTPHKINLLLENILIKFSNFVILLMLMTILILIFFKNR